MFSADAQAEDCLTVLQVTAYGGLRAAGISVFREIAQGL